MLRCKNLKTFLLVGLMGLVFEPAPAVAGESASAGPSSANLPLEEVLRLYRAQENNIEPASTPPMGAVLSRLELTAHLLDRRAEVAVRVVIEVLGDSVWTRTPILALGEDTRVSSLPVSPNGVLSAENGMLFYLSRRRGRHALELAVLLDASVEGTLRKTSLKIANATLASLTARFDEERYRLVRPARSGPVGGVFSLEWERLSEGEEEPEEVAPIEPVVERAHAVIVVTLEGRRVIRFHCSLRVPGSRTLSVIVPEGHRIEQVYRNGKLAPFSAAEGQVELEVVPRRPGERSGTLELVLSATGAAFQLSGNVEASVPTVSWPVHELYLDLYLPAVFTYSWTGGTLEPVEATPETSFSYSIPEPGKRLSFYQVLVMASAPEVSPSQARLEYAVDLKDRYFRP